MQICKEKQIWLSRLFSQTYVRSKIEAGTCVGSISWRSCHYLCDRLITRQVVSTPVCRVLRAGQGFCKISQDNQGIWLSCEEAVSCDQNCKRHGGWDCYVHLRRPEADFRWICRSKENYLRSLQWQDVMEGWSCLYVRWNEYFATLTPW